MKDDKYNVIKASIEEYVAEKSRKCRLPFLVTISFLSKRLQVHDDMRMSCNSLPDENI